MGEMVGGGMMVGEMVAGGMMVDVDRLVGE